MKKVQGVSGKQYELWEEEEIQEQIKKPKRGYDAVTVEQVRDWSREMIHQQNIEALKNEIIKIKNDHDKWKQKAEGATSEVAVLMGLIEEYGLCRPELQVGRMGLDEAYRKWREKLDREDKEDFLDTLGRFSKAIAKEMKKKGEL
jgi:hypothetical protein